MRSSTLQRTVSSVKAVIETVKMAKLPFFQYLACRQQYMRQLSWSLFSNRRCSASPSKAFQSVFKLKVLRAVFYTNHVVRPKRSGIFCYLEPLSMPLCGVSKSSLSMWRRHERDPVQIQRSTDHIAQINASLHQVLHIIYLVQPGRSV